MKPIAYFLIACLLFLTSMEGAASLVRTKAMTDCCRRLSCKDKKAKQDMGCDSKACNRMASCSRCGFVITEQLLVLDQIGLATDKPVLFSTIDIVTGYPHTDWHPPKA